MKIWAYSPNSKSAKALSKATGMKLIKHKNSKFKWNEPYLNWGSSNPPVMVEGMLNAHAMNAVDKVLTLMILADDDVPTIDWTGDRDVAEEWVKEGERVFSRTIVDGHGGEGIVEGVVPAPLYTKYKKKSKEFRVHVIGGNVVRVAEKRLKKDAKWNLIRNHKNGYVFCTNNVEEPESLRKLAEMTMLSLGLEFGAVDIIWNKKEDMCYVLEVNSAPALEGSTILIYAEHLKLLAEGTK